MKRPLNIRQERFCELVASGNSATQAYIEAGYKVSEKVAGTNGPRMLQNAGIKARISNLRAPQTKKTLSSRDEKRELLREIFMEKSHKLPDRLRALELDAKLAGQFEPDRTEIDVGQRSLQSIKERAATVVSTLVNRYRTTERS